MIQRLRHKNSFAFIEYIVLLLILMATFLTFKDYFLRALAGKWKATGDQFGYGRQFHPTDTVECVYDSVYTNRWYDVTCFENKNCPGGNPLCEQQAIKQCYNDFCDNN